MQVSEVTRVGYVDLDQAFEEEDYETLLAQAQAVGDKVGRRVASLQLIYALAGREDLSSRTPFVLGLCEDEDYRVRLQALSVLGRLPAGDVKAQLDKALDARKKPERVQAIRSVGELGDPTVSDLVEKALRDRKPLVRIEALDVAPQIPGLDLERVVEQGRADSNWFVRRAAGKIETAEEL